MDHERKGNMIGAIIIMIVYLTTLVGLYYGTFLSLDNMEFNLQSGIGKTNTIGERLLYEQFGYEIISSHKLNLIQDFKVKPQCDYGYTNIDIRTKRSDYYNFAYKMGTINNITIDSSPFQFCVIYNNQYNYEKLLNMSSKGNCSIGYIPCGILDTVGNLLCLPEGSQCPLNDIIIDIPEKTDLISQGYIQNNIDATTSFYFYYGQSKTNHVVVDILFSIIRPFSHDYDFLVNDDISKRDASFDFLQIKEDHYYQRNKGKPIRINERPARFSLYSKNYIGIKDYQKYQEIFNPIDYTDNPLYKVLSNPLVPNKTILIVCIVFSFLLLFPCLFCCIFPNRTDSNSMDSPLGNCYYITIAVIPTLCSIVLGYIFIKDYYFAKSSYVLINDNFDEIMQEVINLYNKRVFPQSLRIVALIFLVNIIITVGGFAILSALAIILTVNETCYHRME